MSDHRKFTLLIISAAALVVLVLSSHAFLGEYLSRWGERGRRQWHYENALKGKGLDLHEGSFWKTKE